MARQPSLRSQLNQIRAWVRQGRTDAWIAHQLDISIEQLERFKSEHELDSSDQVAGRAIDPLSVPVPEARPDSHDQDEIDEDDEEPADEAPSRSPRRSSRGGRDRGRSDREQTDKPQRGRSEGKRRSEGQRRPERARPGDGDGDDQAKRRRGRRGGRRRKIPTYEATFDHGGEGYGLWLDPAIVDNPVYMQHWSGHRAVEVRLDPDSITIRRAGASKASDDDKG